MYSPVVVEKSLYHIRKSGLIIKHRSVDECRSICQRLAALLKPEGGLERPLTTDEAVFIRSETAICKLDFRYWATRYGNIERDASMGTGVGPMEFWTSQERALELISKREEEIHGEYEKHGFSDGILSVWHKSRQLGATAIMRLISAHRMTLYRNIRCITASLDNPKIHDLYVRDKVILDNLPFFLKPSIEFDVKDSHIGLQGLKSRLVYQQANQEAGIGTGGQFDIGHMTEVALWQNAWRLKFDFFPAIPQSPTTFLGMESTANGRGDFWHEHTENIRQKRHGFEHWLYIFTPWYIEAKKYRRLAPSGWHPNKVSVEHSALVERTSAEFTGYTVRLSKDQLFWWETEYEQARRDGTLPMFLTNYCATPDQSFQHSSGSALPLETLEWMRSTAKMGMPYEVAGIAVRA